MDSQKVTINIWRDALGYVYSDRDSYKSQLTMIESFGKLIARLAATIQYSEDTDEIVMYKIEISKNIYND